MWLKGLNIRTETELDVILQRAFQRCQGAQIYDETRRLLSLLNRCKIQNILEIGSEGGGTLSIWLEMFPGVHVVNVDLNSYPHVKGREVELEALWKSWCIPGQSIQTVWGDSHLEETKEQVRKLLPDGRPVYDHDGKVDLLYIDGDHSEKGVEQDYLMYKEFVRSPGLIVFHDILPYPGRENDSEKGPGVGVYKFWDRLKEPAVDMFQDRGYHRGARPNFIEIFHDKERQSSFGFGVLFV